MNFSGNDNKQSDQLPIFPDLMVLVPGNDNNDPMIIEKIPAWVAAWIGKIPDEVEGTGIGDSFDSLTKAFSSVSSDILKTDIPVDDYIIEFTDIHGVQRIISINAHRIMGYSQGGSASVHRDIGMNHAVLIRIRDISSHVIKTRKIKKPFAFNGIVGRSAPIKKVFDKIKIYGPSDAPVVITGETGTGKELVARALHNHSPRKNGPFVTVNCSGLNEELFESELFGHEKGSFTGAYRAHRGRFERAQKGTLFLDEIGDMPGISQVKLLRVLETDTIERVGGEREISIDVRLIAATNIPLEKSVAEKRFRSDLYHRIAVFRIHVPPLRERKKDIILLIHYFLQLLNRRYKKDITQVTPEALRLLKEYRWPGNVREMRNVLERVYVETQGTVIGHNAFNEWVQERDYLSAGDWNIERLDDGRAFSNAIVQSSSTLPPHILEQIASQNMVRETLENTAEDSTGQTIKKYTHTQFSRSPGGFSRVSRVMLRAFIAR